MSTLFSQGRMGFWYAIGFTLSGRAPASSLMYVACEEELFCGEVVQGGRAMLAEQKLCFETMFWFDEM